jgi:hypothetical protein
MNAIEKGAREFCKEANLNEQDSELVVQLVKQAEEGGFLNSVSNYLNDPENQKMPSRTLTGVALGGGGMGLANMLRGGSFWRGAALGGGLGGLGGYYWPKIMQAGKSTGSKDRVENIDRQEEILDTYSRPKVPTYQSAAKSNPWIPYYPYSSENLYNRIDWN